MGKRIYRLDLQAPAMGLFCGRVINPDLDSWAKKAAYICTK